MNNNRGMTLLELLVSIVLVSVVLLFLFRILNDLKDEVDNNNYAFSNQVNRTELIYTIQKDLNKYDVNNVTYDIVDGNLVINFVYLKSGRNYNATLKRRVEKVNNKDKYYLDYTSYDNKKYSFEMKGAEVSNCINFVADTNASSNYYYFKLNIYLYNSVYNEKNNKDRNNAVDDIEIDFVGKKENFNLSTLDGIKHSIDNCA